MRCRAGSSNARSCTSTTIVDRTETGASLVADRRVQGVADHERRRDDRRAEQRAEHDEQRFALAPECVAAREPDANGEQSRSASGRGGSLRARPVPAGSRRGRPMAGPSTVMSPSRTWSTRSPCSPMARSCVTRTTVQPEAWTSSSRSITAAAVCVSRLPVGSSAHTIAGSATSARAMATRCCSPPDSSAGR